MADPRIGDSLGCDALDDFMVRQRMPSPRRGAVTGIGSPGEFFRELFSQRTAKAKLAGTDEDTHQIPIGRDGLEARGIGIRIMSRRGSWAWTKVGGPKESGLRHRIPGSASERRQQ